MSRIGLLGTLMVGSLSLCCCTNDGGGSTNKGTGGVVEASGGTTGGGPISGGTSTGGMTGSGGTGGLGGSTTTPCDPAAQYPAPDLSGSPTAVFSGQGSGLFEGPVWIGGSLYFSDMTWAGDVPPSNIMRLTPPSTEAEVFLQNAGSNGLAVNTTGELLGCLHSTQDVSTISLADGSITPIVTDYNGSEFNSPNDLVVRADGNIYFTDPDWQRGSRPDALGYTGVFRISPQGAVSVVDDSLYRPNGVTLSPDESVLYVGDYSGDIGTYPVNSDGSTGARQSFASATAPDGMTVDCGGNLYVASSGGVQVFQPDGTVIGAISVGPDTTNVAFGGPDRQTLYITAGKTLYSKPMNLAGRAY